MIPFLTKISVKTLVSATHAACVNSQVRHIIYSAREPFMHSSQLEGPAVPILTNVDTTLLEGGVKVSSVDKVTPLSTISVYLKAGSRYETSHTTNSSSFLKYLAFKGSHEKSAIRMVRDLEHIGANVRCNVTRDHISFHVGLLRFPSNSTYSVGLQIAVETLRYVLNPLLLEYEIERVRPSVEREAAARAGDPRSRVLELLHAEAFRDSGLGNPLYPMSEYLSLTGRHLHRHVSTTYYPGHRMHVVGTGIAHDVLVEKTRPLFTKPELQGKFRELKALLPLPDFDAASVALPPPGTTTLFVGGGMTLRLTGPGNLVHMGLAYPGFASSSNDNIALTVLAHVLGGGKAGIPETRDIGKSTSRLFSNVVEKHTSIKEASVIHEAYDDAGLLVVYVVAEGGKGREALALVREELKAVAGGPHTGGGVSEQELQRAKRVAVNRFLSTVGREGEGGFTALADHLVALAGKSECEYVEAIEAVTPADVARVARVVLGSTPVLVAIGDVRGVPRVNY